MNKPIVILCIIALILNSYFIFVSPEQLNINWTGGDDDDDDSFTSDFNVTVPSLNYNDIANYNDQVFAEMYWINYTTGNWSKITLDMNGKVIMNVLNRQSQEDGFGVIHQTVPISEYIEATVMLRVQDHEGEDIVINGNAEINRIDYRDLINNRAIKSTTDGEVGLDKTLQVLIPLSFTGSLRSYPNPNTDVQETLDEIIYGDGKPIKLNQTGKIDKDIADDDSEASFFNTVYHWKADKGETVSGYKSVRLNITATFGETEFTLPFKRQIWIANDVSQPVKVFTRTNQSYADEESKFYIILENTRTLKTGGFTRGDLPVEYNVCSAEHYITQHPTGEYLSWQYMPQAGTKFDDSSFTFNPNEAISIAMQESSELKKFLDDRSDIVMDYAQFNSTHDPKEITQTGSHRWLLVFGHKLSNDEIEYYWENDITPKERYGVQVTYNTTKLGIGDTKEVEVDFGPLNWSTEYSIDDLEDKMLTLASAEEILKLDSEVENKLYNNPLTPNTIYWDDPLGKTQCFLGQGISGDELPSSDLIETLTGFTIPSSKISWVIQKGQLYDTSGADQGSTFVTAVDTETGQMQYVMEITGTSLFQLFG
jgi:hypothetical protein